VNIDAPPVTPRTPNESAIVSESRDKKSGAPVRAPPL